jgi:hypothetical protein
MLEWNDGEAWIEIVSQGMFLTGNITKFAFSRAFCQTEYGISRYETSPFLMNIAFYGGIVVLNDDYLAMNLIEVPSKWGYFEMKDLTLDYYDNYMAMGITPLFKKYNASDWDTGNSNNRTKPSLKAGEILSNYIERAY